MGLCRVWICWGSGAETGPWKVREKDWRGASAGRFLSGLDVDGAHHAKVFVVEDVAVVHGGAGEIGELVADVEGAPGGD